MIHINKTLMVILVLISIFAAFFMLFVFPIISGEYRENNMITTILSFCLIIFGIERLGQLFIQPQDKDMWYEAGRHK